MLTKIEPFPLLGLLDVMTGEAGSIPTDLLEEEAEPAEPKPFRNGDPGTDADPLGKGIDDGAGRGGYKFIRKARQAGPGGKVGDAMTHHKQATIAVTEHSPSLKTCCTALGWIRVVLVTRQLSIQFAILRTSVSETSLDITSSAKCRKREKRREKRREEREREGGRDRDRQTDRQTDR